MATDPKPDPLGLRKKSPPEKPDPLGLRENTVMDYVASGVSQFNRGVSQVITEPLKMAGAAQRTVMSALGYPEDAPMPGPYNLEEAGQAVQEFVNAANPVDSSLNETFSNVSRGVGQGVGMLLTAGGSAAPSLAQAATKVPTVAQSAVQALGQLGRQAVSLPGVVGGSMVAAPEWEAAKSAGASDEEAFETMVKNYFVGQTELLPITNLLNRINKATGNKLINVAKASGMGGVEEGIQESVQTYLTNRIAREDYDPDRDPLFQVLESAKTGAIVGLILPGVGAAIQSAKPEIRERIEKKLQPKIEAGEAVVQTEQALAVADEAIQTAPVDPIIAAQQDATFNEVTDVTVSQESIPGPVSDSSLESTPGGQTGTIVSDQNQSDVGGSIGDSGNEVQPGGIQTTQTDAGPNRSSLQRQINQDTGVTREKTPIQSDEYILLKKQIRDFSRGFKQGRKEGAKEATSEAKESTRQFGQLVSDFLGGITRTGQKVQQGTNKDGSPRMVEETIKSGGIQLPEAKQNAIVKRMTRVNLNNQRSVDSFLNYLGRTIEDTKYDEKVSDTESAIGKIKGRIKSLPAAIQPEVRKFIQTPVEYTSIDDHQAMATKIQNFLSQPGTSKYKPLNLVELSDYNERMRAEITKQRNVELAETLGISNDDSEFTPEEIDRILSDDDVDPFAANADDARKTQITDALRKQAEYTRIGLEPTLAESPQTSEVLRSMEELDLNSLTPRELKAYIKAVDNVIVNGDFSGTGWIWAKNEAHKGAEKLKNIKALDIVSSVEGVGSILTPAMMTKAIFGTSARAAQVHKNTGVSETYNGYTRTENVINEAQEEYFDLVERLDKTHGGDVRSRESTIRQAIAAYLIRYKSDPVFELAQKKQDLMESVERTKALDPEVAQIAADVLSEFNGAKTQDEVMELLKQRDIKSAKVLEFFLKKYEGIVDDLAANTEIYYNEPFVKEFNYTPVSLKSIGDGLVIDELGAREGIFQTSSPLKPKRATTTIEATGRIPQDRVLDLDFAESMFKRFKDSVYDIETAKHKLQVREFAKLPESDRLFAAEKEGQQTNKQNFYKYYNIVEQENRGKSPFERDAFTTLNKAMAVGRDISYTMLFGDPLKYFTQYAPGAVNSMWNLGPAAFLGARPSQAEKVMKNYPISKRGERFGGTDFNDRIFNATAFQVLGKSSGLSGAFEKSHQFLQKIKKGVTVGFLKGDIHLAKRAWTGAYTKYLADRGVKVDWNTEDTLQGEPLRQEAAAYAEQFVSENMGVNQSSQYAKALKASSGGKRFLMDLVFPLSGYPINMKTRMVENFKFMKIGDKAARTEAFRNQVGTISEAVLYSALTYYIISSIWGGVKDEISEWAGLDSPEDDEEKDKLRGQMFRSQLANDLNPFVTGDALSYSWNWGLNRFAYMMREDEDQLYKAWSEETGEPFSTFEKTGPSANLGIYSILGRSFEPSLQYMFQIKDDELVTDANRYPLTQEQADFIEFNAWVQLFQSFGLGVPVVSKQLDAIRREQIKMIKQQ